jgi:hypothetical protein
MNPDQVTYLSTFLVQAKRSTYAGLNDDATIPAPIFPGSKQLEYGKDSLRYRDIYFGMEFFVGQEVVLCDDRAIWSMGYAGGVSGGKVGAGEVRAVYSFLRRALLRVSEKEPYRGPPQFDEADFSYTNTVEGNIREFRGVEAIYVREARVYRLHYSGGLVR